MSACIIALLNFKPSFCGVDRTEFPVLSSVNFYYHHFLPISQLQLDLIAGWDAGRSGECSVTQVSRQKLDDPWGAAVQV